MDHVAIGVGWRLGRTDVVVGDCIQVAHLDKVAGRMPLQLRGHSTTLSIHFKVPIP